MELLIFLGSLFFFMLLGVPLALVLVLCAIVLMRKGAKKQRETDAIGLRLLLVCYRV